MFAAGSMAMQAASLDSQDPETARIRHLIINRGCDLVDRFHVNAVSEPAIDDIVVCRVQRASDHEALKENDEARRLFNQAIAFATARHQKLPRMDAALAITRGRQGFAEFLRRQKDLARAAAQVDLMRAESRMLAAAHDDRNEFAQAEAEASGQLGDVLIEQDKRAEAIQSYN